MANQMDFFCAGLLQHIGDAQQQLLAAHFSGMHRRHQHREDLCTEAAQRRDDAIPIGVTEQADKTE